MITDLLTAIESKMQMPKPKIVVLCGSTRFSLAFQEANLKETLSGNIVLSIGCDTKSDQGLHIDQETKEQLDLLHLWKIDLADEVLVLNVGGYVGVSTAREIDYAIYCGKKIRYLEPNIELSPEFYEGEPDEHSKNNPFSHLQH